MTHGRQIDTIDNLNIIESTLIENSAGSASAPSYTFTNDSNTGIYNGGSDQLNFSTGGSDQLKITNTLTTSNNRSYQSLPYTSGFYKLESAIINRDNQELALSTWNGYTAASLSTWLGISWSGRLRLFVGIGVNALMTSNNGIVWTTRTPPSSNDWRDVLWVDGPINQFIAVSRTSSSNAVSRSSNGIAWSLENITPAASLNGLCYSMDLNTIVLIGVNAIYTSSNGTTWTARTSPANNDWRGVAWAPELGIFVGVSRTGTGNRVMTSTNAITWTINQVSIDRDWRKLIWVSELGLFVALAAAAAAETDLVMTSPDGFNWTIRNLPNAGYVGLTWSPQLGALLAVSNTRIATSYDGITWIERTPSSAIAWECCCWSPDVGAFCVLATGGAGRVMTTNYNARIPSSLNTMNQLLLPDGTVTEPSHSFNTDTNTGIYNIGADNLGVTCNGVKQVDISTTNTTFTNKVIAPSLQITTTPTSGYVLTSDASGNATWQINPFSYTQPIWTPALVAGVNATLVSRINAQYTRIGNLVLGTVYFNCTVTLVNTLTQVSWNPPISVPTQLICTGVVSKPFNAYNLNSGICKGDTIFAISAQFITDNNVETAFQANFQYHIY